MTPLAKPRPRKQQLACALLLYATGALLMLSPIGSAAGIAPPGGLGPPALLAVADDAGDPSVATPAPITELTDIQRGQALRVLKKNGSFRRTLNGLPFEVAKAGPWTTYGGQELLGAALVVTLPNPVTLQDAPLPAALYDVTEQGATPYQQVVNRVDARSVREFLVLVDFGSDKVVNISPGPGSDVTSVTPPRGFQRLVPMPDEAATSGERGN